MRIFVTGSIATDHLMVFEGRFTEQLISDKLHTVSLSFLVDDLEVRRGGVAANISYGLGLLGLAPVLAGAVGNDFADYRSWLERNGVDTSGVLVSSRRHTARFVCTTDADQNQIASFYAGAMAEARDISLTALADRRGVPDLVVVGPNDPEAMLRHAEECRLAGYPFASDISQQLARLGTDEVRNLVDGAAYLFTNEYEADLLRQRTGWSTPEILARVGTWVTTLGAAGVRLDREDRHPVLVSPPRVVQAADPTGSGDAFRAGFLAGIAWRLGDERAAQLGCLMAGLALEVVGTQEYQLDPAQLHRRVRDAYGDRAAADLAPHLYRAVRSAPDPALTRP